MKNFLTRDRALAETPPAPRIPSQLEVVAQQALALQAQTNALVGVVLAMLEAQQPHDDDERGPAMPPTFGSHRPQSPHTEVAP